MSRIGSWPRGLVIAALIVVIVAAEVWTLNQGVLAEMRIGALVGLSAGTVALVLDIVVVAPLLLLLTLRV